MLDKLLARAKNTFNKAHIEEESPVKENGAPAMAAPPTKMGYFLRSLGRRADSQPAEEAKPRKLQKKKQPGVTRAESSESRTEPAPIQPARDSPQPALSANADDNSPAKPKETDEEAMKPIGEYPSPAEYKGVGLTPHVKNVAVNKRANLVPSGDKGIMTDVPLALAPEEVIVSAGTRVDNNAIDGGAPHRGVENVASLKGSVEDVLGEEVSGGSVVDDDAVPSTTFTATPTVDEAVAPRTATALAFFSPVGSPADTTVDETMTDFVPTVPETHITAPDAGTQSPPVIAADGMASDSEKPISRDYIAVLNSLPLPASNVYDVSQLKRVLEIAIAHAQEAGDDDVALSLVHYWSEISHDEFKLSLIYNIGCENSDHKLELALKAMLRHSFDDATKWYEAHELDRAKALLRGNSESGLSSARSPGAEPLGQTPFRAADIYRETSGSRLEEAFLTGKTNTVPLKRPKKPVPANENSFKRRREWEADSTLEETLREKRARLAEDAASESQISQRSSVRPEPVPETSMEKTSILTEQPQRISLPAESTADEARAAAAPSISSPRLQRAAKRRQAQRGSGKQQSETVPGGRATPSTSGRTATHLTQPLSKVDSGYESDHSHPYFSPKIRPWGLGRTHPSLPERSESFENMDECYNCDGPGELLCCDTCENALHFRCVRPRLDPDDPLEGEWHCRRCDAEGSYTNLSETVEAPSGPRTNSPKFEYGAPKEAQERFIGVEEFETTVTGGRPDLEQRYYASVPHLPRLTKLPPKNAPRLEYNDPELLKLFENGRPIFCTKCGRSTEWVRPIIRCDYCECRFHLDCLDPPLANPPDPVKGWMCPTHIRPDELVVTKMVNGRMQQRRVRRPKTFASLDIEIDTSDDFRETSFDEDWRESRGHLPAGDVVLDFVTSVKQKHKNVMRDYCENLAKASIDWIKKRHEAYLKHHGIPLEGNELPEAFSTDLATAIEDMRTGRISVEQYNAAFDLLTLAQGGPPPTSAPESSSSSTTDSTSPVGQRKRSRTEPEEDSGEQEPASKRQNRNPD